MAELEYAYGLGPYPVRVGGSSPPRGTKEDQKGRRFCLDQSQALMTEFEPKDRLLTALIDEAKRASAPEAVANWSPRPINAIANGLAPLLGALGSLAIGKDPLGGVESLERYVQACGMNSIEELKESALMLRDELRGELSPEDWNAYFSRSIRVFPVSQP